MNAEHDHLDAAIDAVAARLTHIEDNPALASRIVSALPERSAWSLHWLMPRLAITAALAVATTIVVLRTFDEGSTEVLRTEVVSSPIVELPAPIARTVAEPSQIVRRTIVERPQNERRTIEVPDFERSLPSIAAARSLELDSLAPVSLPEDAPLTLEPLAIADLPLTAEFSPR